MLSARSNPSASGAGLCLAVACLAACSPAVPAPSGVSSSSSSSVLSRPVSGSALPSAPVNSAPAQMAAVASPSIGIPPAVTRLLKTAGLPDVAWAPDSAHVAVMDQDRPDDSSLISIFDTDGQRVRQFAGWQLAWTGPGTFVVMAEAETGPNLFGGSLARDTLVPLGRRADWLLGGGNHAATWAEGPGGYVVWQANVPSGPRDGSPLAWSRDGSLLAVETGTGLAVVQESDGRVVRDIPGVSLFAHSVVSFSPAGDRILVTYDTIVVADVSSGMVSWLGPVPSGRGEPEWLDDSHIAINDGGQLQQIDLAGQRAPVAGVGDGVAIFDVAGSGSLLYADDAMKSLTIVRNGQSEAVPLPGQVPLPRWSPDGQYLVITFADEVVNVPDVVLVKP
jgi:hypothetical protein